MNSIRNLLSASVLLCLLLNSMPTDAQTDCPDTLTTSQFIEYVKRVTVCRVDSSLTLFRYYAPILDSVYDEHDAFIGQINYDDVDAFCSDVADCKNALSSCQGQLDTVIKEAGKALCQNGKAMTQALKAAVSTLSNGGCDLSKLDDITLSRDGCYLGRDEALPQTYALDIIRAKKIESAQERCALRFMRTHDVCSLNGAEAYGTILAASQDLELIDTMYDSFTSFQQKFGSERKSMKLFGLTHLSYDEGTPTTCTGLPSGSLLLWNTRLRITGSLMPLTPMSSFHALSQLTIEFYGADGVLIDSYMASDRDVELSYQTEREHGNLGSEILAERIDKNHVLLTYPDIATTISVGYYGNNLALVAFMPSSLLVSETVGLLIDGCQLYSSVSTYSVQSTSECINECNAVKKHKSLCELDCSNQLEQYTELYDTLESLTVAASEFSVSGSPSLTDNLLLLAVAVLSYPYIL